MARLPLRHWDYFFTDVQLCQSQFKNSQQNGHLNPPYHQNRSSLPKRWPPIHPQRAHIVCTATARRRPGSVQTTSRGGTIRTHHAPHNLPRPRRRTAQ
ncbi:hypothetical protein M3J09_000227 [Ascochyta lentis]